MNILIAEDEEHIANRLRKNFVEEGHNSIIAKDGEACLELINSLEFDVILLDWHMPKLSGIDVCSKIRSYDINTPIILLTALTDISNKIKALNEGADDYITKPFSFEELLARINAVKRRYDHSQNKFTFGVFELNLLNRKLELPPNNEIKLSEKEFDLLKYLILNKGQILSKEELSKNIWEQEYNPRTNVVESTVKNLRKKLENETIQNISKPFTVRDICLYWNKLC